MFRALGDEPEMQASAGTSVEALFASVTKPQGDLTPKRSVRTKTQRRDEDRKGRARECLASSVTGSRRHKGMVEEGCEH